MANSIHLKRHSMPTSWPIKRKNITFVAKPKPGSHKRDYVITIVALLRDVLGVAETSKEAKLIVNTKDVLVNGKKVTDIRSPCGLFDVVEIKDLSKKYVILFDSFGKIKLKETKDDTLYLKLSNKKVISGGKFQFNFMNGFNVLVDEKTFNSAKVNDTLVYDFSKKKIVKSYPLKEGSFVYVFDGKFKGQFGQIKSFILYNGVTKDIVSIEINGKAHDTAKDYVYVIGDKKEDLKRFD